MPRARQARIYQRPGRAGWYCDLDGTERRISLGTSDETEARRRFAERLQHRRLLEASPGTREIAALFAETHRRSKGSNTPKTAYELHLNLTRILVWLDERGITTTAQLSKQVVEDFKTSRRFAKSKRGGDKISAARVNAELTAWRRAVRIAVELGAINPSAPDWFVRLREPRPEPHQRGYTKAQLERFLKAAPSGYSALFRVALGTGMRDDELRHMDAGDLRGQWIVVTPKPGWTTKGYRYRKIPVKPATIKAAREFIKARPSLSLGQKKVWSVAHATATAVGLERLSMHDLRRAWASHVLAAGHRIEDVSRWLGHADVLTTMRYLRVVDDRHPGAKKLPW